MITDKYKQKYRISTARVSWHDYSVGSYFITICTSERKHYLGEIIDAAMNLSECGNIAVREIRNIPTYYAYAECPLFTVMPNHIHAIIMIHDMNNSDALNRVSTEGGITKDKNPMNACKLGTVVRGIKARITRHVRERGENIEWQSRYYEHIIRNQDEMNHIAEYIENNVAQWDLDEMNKNNSFL